MDLDSVRHRHGGYWRDSHLDFHYLFNQYFPPPELYAELQTAVLSLANSYPSGQRVLAQLLSRWKDAAYFDERHLVVGNGSSELIKLLNDRVLGRTTVPLPTFNEFTVRPSGDIHRYPLEETSGFTLDVDRLLQEVKRSRSRDVVLVNPNNPVGNLASVDDIRRILESGVRLVIDEAFMAFTDPGYSAEPLVEQYDNLVIVTSATKSLGIAGLRLGYVLTTNADVLRRLRDALPIWNVNSLAEYVLESFPRYRALHRESIERIKADREWFSDALARVPYLDPFPSHANAVFCRVRGNGRRLAELLFERYAFVVKEGIQQAELQTRSWYVRMGIRNRDDNGRLVAALESIDAGELAGEHAPALTARA